MAIIYTYPVKAIPNTNDLILISDSQDSNNTKQVTIGSLPGGSGSGVSSVTSSNVAITVADASTTPVLTSVAYTGTTNVGHVPAGGSATTFLRGDGSWVVPTDTIVSPSLPLNGVQYRNANGNFEAASSLIFESNNGKLIVGDQANDIYGIIEIQSDNDVGAELKIQGGGGFYTTIRGAQIDTASYNITLPVSGPGGNDKILQSNSSGDLSWIDTPSGSGVSFSGTTVGGVATFSNSSTALVNSEVILLANGQMTFNGSVSTSGIKYDLTSTTLRVGDVGENSGSIGLYADGLEKITVSPNSTTIADNHPLITKITTTTAGYGNGAVNAQSSSASSGSAAPIRTKVGSTTGGRHIEFYNPSGVVSGSISQTSASTVAYNVSSDYRLKENVVDMIGAVDRLKELKPSRFNFIIDGAGRTVDGFLAHEVSSIVPEAITGDKDAVDAENNIIPQGIDQSKLVPLLVGAIKELTARIEALEA